MYRVLVHHRNEYGEEPEVVVDVPGVMTILGSYSDFCDGYALMCTNTQGLRLAISRRADNTVKVYNHTIQDRKKFQLSGLKCKSDDKWISTVKAVFIALQHDGITLPGMDISITGRTAHSDYDTLAAAVAAAMAVIYVMILFMILPRLSKVVGQPPYGLDYLSSQCVRDFSPAVQIFLQAADDIFPVV